jgi:hypothetical protein
MKKYKILKDSSVNSADIKADDYKGEDWLHDDAKILDSAKMFGRAEFNNSASIYMAELKSMGMLKFIMKLKAILFMQN